MEFEKYRKIYRLGHEENQTIFSDPEDEIIIEEKIDGGNFRFYITKEGKIIIGSRTQQLTSNEGEDTNMNKNFKRCSDYIRERLSEVKDLTKYSGMIFYGENCVKHTITYNWDDMPPFLGFDIKTEDGYMDYENKVMTFTDLNLHVVPLVDVKKAKEIKEVNDDVVPKSKFASLTAKDQKAEGIVFKNYNKQIMAKYVRDVFKEKNAEVFGGTPKYNKEKDNDNAEILFKYCPNPRIDKMIFKLIDEGHKLDMTMMHDLPKRVWKDIFDEEGLDIWNSKYVIDLKDLRKKVTRRCLAVLNMIITNNALTEEEK